MTAEHIAEWMNQVDKAGHVTIKTRRAQSDCGSFSAERGRVHYLVHQGSNLYGSFAPKNWKRSVMFFDRNDSSIEVKLEPGDIKPAKTGIEWVQDELREAETDLSRLVEKTKEARSKRDSVKELLRTFKARKREATG